MRRLKTYLLVGVILLASVSSHASRFFPRVTGTTLPPTFGYQVHLTWDAPSSSPDPVATYNAYRAPSGGTSYVLLNTTPIPLTPTTYSDPTVQFGQTYNYIVESVDAQGVTSTPSNTAVVPIPGAPAFLPTPFVIGKPTAS